MSITSSAVDNKMITTYEKLVQETLTRYDIFKQNNNDAQYWIAIAGPPGSGKSTLSTSISNRINTLKNDDISIVLPMDGYHYSRAQLKSISNEAESKYTYDDLIARRGSPWTFDANSLVRDLYRVKNDRYGSLPMYERKISDPVPNAIHLKASHKLIFVEGNYLLNYDDELWAPLKDLFHEKWFITCSSTQNILSRLIKRHLETWSEEKTKMWGDGEVGAKRKAEANDLLNAEFIITHSMKYADVIIDSV